MNDELLPKKNVSPTSSKGQESSIGEKAGNKQKGNRKKKKIKNHNNPSVGVKLPKLKRNERKAGREKKFN